MTRIVFDIISLYAKNSESCLPFHYHSCTHAFYRATSCDSPVEADVYSAAQKNFDLCVSAANHITSIGTFLCFRLHYILANSKPCYSVCVSGTFLHQALFCIFKLLYFLSRNHAHDIKYVFSYGYIKVLH